MKAKYVILLCACLVCIGICINLNFMYQISMQDDGEILEELRDSIKQFENSQTKPADTQTSDSDTNTDDTAPDTGNPPEDSETLPPDTSEDIPAEDLLDFQALWDINSEICAWIEITGTKIDYPVLQSKDSDKKYLTTAYDGSPYIGGAIFTEGTYNNNDFNDPVTVIYGHTMRAGTLFGQLQKTYSQKDSFDSHSEIKLYLPGEVRLYRVFAAVPYSNIHLMHTYDFSNEYWYGRFFKEVCNIREIGANFNPDITVQHDDRVIILSVCLNADTTRRYLVMAAYEKDLADNS